ncbi:hypothetical protein B0O80DRAFT_459118 [Mortierella sp. GBAus27b]|nr:hypothetical protein B0O80DRAFT_459118 [Mortierella sp. GBAus27b]
MPLFLSMAVFLNMRLLVVLLHSCALEYSSSCSCSWFCSCVCVFLFMSMALYLCMRVSVLVHGYVLEYACS